MKRLSLCIGLLLISLLAACSRGKENKETEIRYTDIEGEKYLEECPKNAAVLYPSFGDIWIASGGVISIGVEDCVTRGYAKEGIPLVGSGTGKDINLESLLKEEPDFVVLSSDFPNHTDIAAKLKNYGIAYGLFEYRGFTDYLSIVESFGNINGNQEFYSTIGLGEKNRIDTVIEKTRLEDARKVLLLRATSTSLKALSSTNFVGGMITDLHSVNIADLDTGFDGDLSMEFILKENPDVILIVPMGDEEKCFSYAKTKLETDVYQSLAAVQNNKVYYMEKDLFHYKPNQRWGEAYEILAERIYAK